jgi:MFS superfamily sulfate permease-like transporter
MALPQKFVRDLSASLVVFLVALPLCMGIALASGAPPAMGLVTGIIGGIVVGSIAGSPLQVSGPAAGLAVLVFEIIHEHGYAALAPILMIAGVVQVAAGAAKLGRWFRAISPAVIHGMLAGIGLLIVFQQFHVMFDNKPKGSGLANLAAVPGTVMHGLFPLGPSSALEASLMGCFTITVMLLWERFRPEKLKLVPGALLGIGAASITAKLLHLSINHVQVPDSLIGALSFPSIASFTAINGSAIGSALALALIASAETLLSAAAVAKMQPAVKTDYDRELLAQGVGNILCGAVGAIPMTGVIVRSSANVQAGATSRLSAILHGVWILGTIVLFASVLRAVPTSSLAGVLVLTGLKLVKVKDIRHLSTFGKVPILIYLATLITIVTRDLLTGVMVGVALSVLVLLYNVTRLTIHTEALPGTNEWRLRFVGSATFVRIPLISAALEKVPANSTVHIITEELSYVDHSCLELLQDWVNLANQNGSRVVLEQRALENKYWTSKTA